MKLNKEAIRNLLILIVVLSALIFVPAFFRKLKIDNCADKIETYMIDIFGYEEIRRVDEHEAAVMQALFDICIE